MEWRITSNYNNTYRETTRSETKSITHKHSVIIKRYTKRKTCCMGREEANHPSWVVFVKMT